MGGDHPMSPTPDEVGFRSLGARSPPRVVDEIVQLREDAVTQGLVQLPDGVLDGGTQLVLGPGRPPLFYPRQARQWIRHRLPMPAGNRFRFRTSGATARSTVHSIK